MTSYIKDPDAALDYEVDWSAWLDGDTITALTVTAGAGITVDSSSHDNTTTTAWVSGGIDGVNYAVRFRVETTDGRIDDRTITLLVRNT